MRHFMHFHMCLHSHLWTCTHIYQMNTFSPQKITLSHLAFHNLNVLLCLSSCSRFVEVFHGFVYLQLFIAHLNFFFSCLMQRRSRQSYCQVCQSGT
jgi:hypothetical protein